MITRKAREYIDAILHVRSHDRRATATAYIDDEAETG